MFLPPELQNCKKTHPPTPSVYVSIIHNFFWLEKKWECATHGLVSNAATCEKITAPLSASTMRQLRTKHSWIHWQWHCHWCSPMWCYMGHMDAIFGLTWIILPSPLLCLVPNRCKTFLFQFLLASSSSTIPQNSLHRHDKIHQTLSQHWWVTFSKYIQTKNLFRLQETGGIE